MKNINPLLIESFLRDSKKAVEIVSGLIEKADFNNTENLQQFRITVHGVKSSLQNVGEPVLSDIARELEDACRAGALDIIDAKAAGFLAGLQDVINKLQPDDNSTANGDDPPDLQEKLAELKEMCADYNRRGALQIIADITVCTAKTRAILNTVKELVQQSDFEEAEALL